MRSLFRRAPKPRDYPMELRLLDELRHAHDVAQQERESFRAALADAEARHERTVAALLAQIDPDQTHGRQMAALDLVTVRMVEAARASNPVLAQADVDDGTAALPEEVRAAIRVRAAGDEEMAASLTDYAIGALAEPTEDPETRTAAVVAHILRGADISNW